jgi:VWFA-related protein
MRSTFVGGAAAVLVVGAALAAGQAPAQNKQLGGSFGSTIEVNEVEMEVHATDRQGREVADLRPDELRLSQDKETVEITGLRRVGANTAESAALPAPGAPAAGPTGPTEGPAGSDPLFLVAFIDNTNIAPFHRRRALGQLWTFLDENLSPADQVMVVAYERGLRVIQPFTSDLQATLRALRDFEGSTLMASSPQLADQQEMRQIQEVQQRLLQGTRTDPCTLIEDMARSYASERFGEVRGAAKGLEALVASLTGLPGRKAVIHISDGIPLIAGLAPLAQVQELCDGSGVRRGVPYAVDLSNDPYDHTDPQLLQMAMADYNSADLWGDVAAYANLRGVTFYTVDAAGAEPVADTGADLAVRLGSLETQREEQSNRLETLTVLAEDTGGRALLNQNDLSGGFAEMMKDLRGYYVLTFRPPSTDPGTVHKLRLETTRPGVELRYRKSYRYRTRHQQVADRLVGAVLQGVAPNPMGLMLAVERTAGAAAGEAGDMRLKLSVPLDQLSLVSSDGEAHGMFTVFVAVLRGDGAVTPVRETTVPVAVPQGQLAALAGKSYVYEVEIALPAGEHQLGLGVLDELAGSSSYLHRKVKI